MSFLPRGLGPKLNLSLIVFMVVLGAATASLIVLGFNRTQSAARNDARAGLEAQSQRVLHEVAAQASTIGQMVVGRGMDESAHGARYMRDARQYGVTATIDGSTLQTGAGGQMFDARPQRVTDVWIPVSATESSTLQRDLSDSAVLDALLPTLLEHNADAVAMYFMSTTGVTRYFPRIDLAQRLPADFAPGVRDRIRRAGPLENPARTTILSAPFQDPAGQGELIAALTPVYIDGQFRGVFGVDLSLARLVGQADSIRLTPSGFAFVLDADGDLLRGRSYETVNAAIEDPANTRFSQTLRNMRNAQTGVDRVTFDGREYFVGYAPLRNVGASLAITAPLDEITAEAATVAASIEDEGNRTVVMTLVLLAALFVAALAGTAWLNRRLLLGPISSLVAGTRAVGAGDLSTRIPVRSDDELGLLARSFNRMTDDIQERTRALRERELQYRSVFESTSDGLLISNFDGELVEANEAASAMHGYTHKEFLLLPRGVWVHPDYREKRLQYIQQVKVGKPFRMRSVDIRRDGTTFPVEALGTAFTYRGEPHILTVLRDVTEQVQAEEILERRVVERTRELRALLDIAGNVASTLELTSVLRVILEQVRIVVPYWRASFFTLESHALVIRAVLEDRADGEAAADSSDVGVRFDVNEHIPLWSVIGAGKPVIIDDIRSDHPWAVAYRRAAGTLSQTNFERVRAWIAVPTMRKGEVVGMLALSSQQAGYFTAHHAELLMAIGNQAAVAIENARLYEESSERARELSALLQTARTVASTLDLDDLLGMILDRLRDVVDYAGCSILTREGDDLVLVRARGPLSPDDDRDAVGLRFSLASVPDWWDNLIRGDAIIVPDVRGDSRDAEVFRTVVGRRMDLPAFRYVRSWIAVPLAHKDRVIGIISASQDTPDYFTPEHARLVRAFADQAAIAIENARLYEESSERARELSALLQIARSVASTLDLDDLLGTIMDRLQDVVDYAGCSIVAREGDDLVVLRARGPAGIEQDRGAGMRFSIVAVQDWWDSLIRGDVMIVPDILDPDDSGAEVYRTVVGDRMNAPGFSYIRSWMGVPLSLKDRVIGMLSVSQSTTNSYTEQHARLVRAFADQAAIAIENARLFEQAQQFAAVEERQRLARELHDSVSQALYGIALGARTARTQLDRDPARAVEPVDYVLSLAEAGLTEMRALIFELRPESLETEGLVAAIEKQTAATRARYNLEVQSTLCEEPPVALDQKEVVYRIAQEALHNIVKHARASRVEVRLECDDELRLEIRDDGIGFDPDGSFPGHIGLRSMRERVTRAGGTIDIASTPGAGSHVIVRLPVRAPTAAGR